MRYVPALHSQLNHWSPMGGRRKCCVVGFPKSQLGRAPSKSIKLEVLAVNAFPRGETQFPVLLTAFFGWRSHVASSCWVTSTSKSTTEGISLCLVCRESQALHRNGRQVGKLLAVTLFCTGQSPGGPTITHLMSLVQLIASKRCPTKAGAWKQRGRFLLTRSDKWKQFQLSGD